jgi:hypothetical protein
MEQLRNFILNLEVVKQIMTINQEISSVEKSMSSTIGSARSALNTVKNYEEKILGTVNYWKNFKAKNMIPIFDPRVFTAFQEFQNLKANMQGGKDDLKNFHSVQPGEPFQYATLETYYTRDFFMDLAEKGQQNAAEADDLNNQRHKNTSIKDINGAVQAAADMAGRSASTLTRILDQTLGEDRNMAVINEARREERNKSRTQRYLNEMPGQNSDW